MFHASRQGTAATAPTVKMIEGISREPAMTFLPGPKWTKWTQCPLEKETAQ